MSESTVMQFVRAIEGRAPVEVIAGLLHDDVVARELPNALFPDRKSVV